jgi:large subunit ribosomal protein L7/L12
VGKLLVPFQIAQLTLLEVADLNDLLKVKLKISDAPVMMAGSFAAGPAAAAPAAEEEEEAPAVAVQVKTRAQAFASGSG